MLLENVKVENSPTKKIVNSKKKRGRDLKYAEEYKFLNKLKVGQGFTLPAGHPLSEKMKYASGSAQPKVRSLLHAYLTFQKRKGSKLNKKFSVRKSDNGYVVERIA